MDFYAFVCVSQKKKDTRSRRELKEAHYVRGRGKSTDLAENINSWKLYTHAFWGCQKPWVMCRHFQGQKIVWMESQDSPSHEQPKLFMSHQLKSKKGYKERIIFALSSVKTEFVVNQISSRLLGTFFFFCLDGKPCNLERFHMLSTSKKLYWVFARLQINI